MSDGHSGLNPNGVPALEDGFTLADVNPTFSKIFDEIFDEETGEETPEEPQEGGTPADGAEAPAPEDEGTAADAPAEGAPDGGTEPAPEPGAEPEPVKEFPKSYEHTIAASTPIEDLFAKASESITSRMESTFRQQAQNEMRSKVDPKYYESLQKHPRTLVGTRVPSVTTGEMEVLRDSADAADWQAAVKQDLQAAEDQIFNDKMKDVQPIRAVIQDTIQLLQSNPDLIPGHENYNKELHDQFVAIAKSNEVRINGAMYGWEGNTQAVLNALREQIAKRQGTVQGAKTAQQQRAAEQPRQEDGTFKGPQAGIRSKSGSVSGGEDDGWGDFWSTAGVKGMSL